MTREEYISIRPNVYNSYTAMLLCLWAYRQDQIKSSGEGRAVPFDAFQQLVRQRYPQQHDAAGVPIPFEYFVQIHQANLLNPDCKIHEAVCHLDNKHNLVIEVFPDGKQHLRDRV